MSEQAGVAPASAGGSGRRLRVGARVRSTNATPVFASDPQPGDAGTVVQSSEADDIASASYLVRWDGGAESWATREHLEPAGRGAFAPAAPQTAGPAPTAPPRGPSRPGGRTLQRFLPLLFVLLAAQGLVRALVRSAHHPSLATAALAAVIVLIVLAAVGRTRRRRGRSPRGPVA